MKPLKDWSSAERIGYSLASLMLVCMVAGGLSVGLGIMKASSQAVQFGFILWFFGLFWLWLLLVQRLYQISHKRVLFYWRGLVILVGAGIGLYILSRIGYSFIANLLVIDIVCIISFAYFYPLFLTFVPKKSK